MGWEKSAGRVRCLSGCEVKSKYVSDVPELVLMIRRKGEKWA